MRTLFTTAIILAFLSNFFPSNVKGQITLEHHLSDVYAGNWFYIANLSSNEHKYVIFDTLDNSFSLYNLNMTPYMTNIVIPLQDSIKHGFTVMYITRTLFDCDSNNIEFVYSKPNNIREKFRVMRTDGTILLEVDSANGPYCYGCYGGSFNWTPIQQTAEGAKLFLQYRDSNGKGHMFIYSLCGNMSNPVVINAEQHLNQIKLFPNPTGMSLHYEIDLPNNIDQFHIAINDISGKEIVRTRIDAAKGGNPRSIDVSTLSSGTYLFSLVANGKVLQSSKFIVTR